MHLGTVKRTQDGHQNQENGHQYSKDNHHHIKLFIKCISL